MDSPALPSTRRAAALLDDAGLEARLTDLVWSSRYRLQHRMAARFQEGRLYLAGDAAHPYSPATGQQPRVGAHAGHRLPDATVTSGGRHVRLHSLLAKPGVHVLLHRDADHLEDSAIGSHVSFHRLTSTPGSGLVAVRPDGYVGFRCRLAGVAQLHAWLERIGAGQSADVANPAQ